MPKSCVLTAADFEFV